MGSKFSIWSPILYPEIGGPATYAENFFKNIEENLLNPTDLVFLTSDTSIGNNKRGRDILKIPSNSFPIFLNKSQKGIIWRFLIDNLRSIIKMRKLLKNYDKIFFLGQFYFSLTILFSRKRKEQKFILNKFIKHLYETDYISYKLLSKFVTGFIFANCIFYSEPSSYKGNITNVKIFLDTRIILRLIGLEGDYRKRCYEEFIKLLKSRGAQLYIFEHTYEETIGIIDDCEKWIKNKRYNPILASPVLKHFVENNFSKDEISLFSSKVNTRLA